MNFQINDPIETSYNALGNMIWVQSRKVYCGQLNNHIYAMLCCYFCFRKDMDFFKLITAATVNPGRLIQLRGISIKLSIHCYFCWYNCSSLNVVSFWRFFIIYCDRGKITSLPRNFFWNEVKLVFVLLRRKGECLQGRSW